MRLILEVISGPHAGQRIIARAGQVVSIGRTPKAAVVIEDTFLSGQHFAIECVGGACGVRDLGSTNGTLLNDKRVTLAVLHDGYRIHAGRTDFLVHIELDSIESDPSLSSQLEPTIPPKSPPDSRRELDVNVLPDLSKQESDRPVNNVGRTTPEAQSRSEPLPDVKHVSRENQPASPPLYVNAGIDAYKAATPQGSLLRILQNQPERLLALVDGTRDNYVLELLHKSGEEYRSLYRDEQNAALAPHLVPLPPQSALLRKMIEKGWGRGWGVYLTSNASLIDLREYFRTALMAKLPDGTEMFSRFYDPRFFRSFLENCTADEAQRYFGPVRAYLMESEKPEILLEFTRNSQGVDKKGHLLSVLQ